MLIRFVDFLFFLGQCTSVAALLCGACLAHGEGAFRLLARIKRARPA
jgi:hypothetical protein